MSADRAPAPGRRSRSGRPRGFRSRRGFRRTRRVDNGKAVVDRVGGEKPAIGEGHRTLRLGMKCRLIADPVSAGRNKPPGRFVLYQAEFVIGGTGGPINLIAPVADQHRRLRRLDLRIAASCPGANTAAGRAARTDRDRQAEHQAFAAALGKVLKPGRKERHVTNLQRIVSGNQPRALKRQQRGDPVRGRDRAAGQRRALADQAAAGGKKSDRPRGQIAVDAGKGNAGGAEPPQGQAGEGIELTPWYRVAVHRREVAEIAVGDAGEGAETDDRANSLRPRGKLGTRLVKAAASDGEIQHAQIIDIDHAAGAADDESGCPFAMGLIVRIGDKPRR